MPKIKEMYAFIVEDSGPDDEGVIGIESMEGTSGHIWLPLVGADMARVESLKPMARDIGHQIGKRVTLVHFTNREDLEVIT